MSETALERLERQEKALAEKREKLKARRKQIESRQKAAERKEDTRRKILLGGAILAELKDEHGELDETLIKKIVSKRVTKERDRSLFKFLRPTSASQTVTPDWRGEKSSLKNELNVS